MINFDSEDLSHSSNAPSTESVTSQTSSKPRSIGSLVYQITFHGKVSDDSLLKSAGFAAELKRRLIAGECGEAGKKWMSWMVKEVKLSSRHLYQLVHIGEAADPEAALEEWRRNARERQKKHREKAEEEAAPKDELGENQKLLIRAATIMTEAEAKAEYLALWQR